MTSKWKRIAGFMLAACFTLSIAGCDNNDDGELSDSSEIIDDDEDNQSAAHKVGFIFNGYVSDGGFTAEMNDQRINAANRCSMDTCYIEGVAVQDFEKAVKQLVSAGCTDIVSASSNFVNVVDSVSDKYMNVNFIGYGTTNGGVNLTSYIETPYQASYISGMVAAYNSRTRKIGFVADTELLYAVQTCNAAALGLQYVYEKDSTLYAAAATRDNEIEDAVDALLEQGCDVIISYTGSTHTEEYCQKLGVSFIGNHNLKDEESSYSKMLMYFYTNRDSYFLSQFKQMKMDIWEPDYYTGNMGNGIINISAACLGAKDGTQDIRDAIAPKVSSNQAYIFTGELTDSSGTVRYLHGESMSESQIINMDWYVKGVEVIGNFRQPQTDIPVNNLEIKE